MTWLLTICTVSQDEFSLKNCTYLKCLLQMNFEFLEHDTRLFTPGNVSPTALQEDFPSLNKIGDSRPFHLSRTINQLESVI